MIKVRIKAVILLFVFIIAVWSFVLFIVPSKYSPFSKGPSGEKADTFEEEVYDPKTGTYKRKSMFPWCNNANADEVTRSLSVSLENFAGALFVGHTNPDTDSVASAIAAAYYYNGKAATAGLINPETTLVLQKFNLEVPPLVSTFPPDQHACLVDFNQRTQLVPYISEDNVVCVIDHHAMQKDTVEISKPIHVEIKTWGSCSSVVAWKYFDTCREMPPEIAGVLLSGVISDTLYLRSPTTTIADQRAVERLAVIAKVKDTLGWAREMFTVKDQFGNMTIEQIVASDFKEFTISDKRVGFGVLETVNQAVQLARKTELLNAACDIKKRRRLDFTFFAIVDVLELRTNLLVCSKTEKEIALLAYSDAAVINDFQIDIGNRVSRKKEFIPSLQRQFRHFSSL